MILHKVLFVFAAAATISLVACSGNNSGSQEEVKVTVTQTETAAYTASETVDSLPTDEFCELPDEAVEVLNYVSDISGEIFPEAAGKKMYGYRGLNEIETESGTFSCYVFDFYTYKSKVYTKVARIAKAEDCSDVYVFNEESGVYELAETPQKEINWHDKATAALAVGVQNTDNFSDSTSE